MKRARSVVTSDDNLSAYSETLRVSGNFSLSYTPVYTIHASCRGNKLTTVSSRVQIQHETLIILLHVSC